jgi:hypothetical protein
VIDVSVPGCPSLNLSFSAGRQSSPVLVQFTTNAPVENLSLRTGFVAVAATDEYARLHIVSSRSAARHRSFMRVALYTPSVVCKGG